MKEIWKDIPEFINYYQASNMGRIRSLDRVVKSCFNSFQIKKGKVLKPVANHNGYLRISLSKNGKRTQKFVSNLVWITFKGQIPKGMQVNHINQIVTDNRLANLNLLSPKENCNWKNHNIRLSKALTNRKDQSKPVLQYDLDGNFIKEWLSTKDVERNTGFANTNISSCCKGKYKQSYGYIWKYKC